MSESYSGGTPSVGVKEYYGGQIPFIRSAEINSEITELFLTEEGLKKSSARLVAMGDILYALYGATSGEVGRARLRGAINQAILAINPHTGYDSEYLAQWLRKSKHSIIETYLQGGQGNLSGTIVKELLVDFPSLKEQRAIGDFFSQLDHLITLHQRKYDKLQVLKKAMLEKMFPKNGSSVPEIRFKGFTDAWEQRKLGELVEIGDIDHRMPETVADGIPYLMTGDFCGTNELNFNSVKMISENDYRQLSQKIKPEQGDIIFARYASVGAARYVDFTRKFLISYSCAIIKQSKKIDSKYLYHFITSASAQKQIKIEINTGSQANIGIDSMKNNIIVDMPLPEEQRKIGIFLTQIDHLITLHQRELEKLQNIKKSMLEKMFV